MLYILGFLNDTQATIFKEIMSPVSSTTQETFDTSCLRLCLLLSLYTKLSSTTWLLPSHISTLYCWKYYSPFHGSRMISSTTWLLSSHISILYCWKYYPAFHGSRMIFFPKITRKIHYTGVYMETSGVNFNKQYYNKSNIII